jgi:tetratricopeptide (TPR) repeat protein
LSFSMYGESSGFEYFAPRNIYSFAEYLFDDGQYDRAAGEYSRFMFATDSFPEKTDSIFFKIALCYRYSEKYKESIDYFRKVINECKESVLLDESYFQIGLSYSFSSSYEQSNEILKSYFVIDSPSRLDVPARQLIALNHIQRKEWDQAREFIYGMDASSDQLLSFIEKGQNLPRKSAFISGLFSTVIPGAGKFYCNRPMDGVHSLVTVGITGWQAYEGFNEDGIHSVKGWIFGVLGGIFYLGNIYGSVVAADIYNQEQDVIFKISVNKYLNENFK